MRIKDIIWPLILALFLIFAGPRQAAATIYSYTDTNGIIHFSNVPSNPLYRPLNGERAPRDNSRESRYDNSIREAARFFNLDPLLIKAVIKKESDFNPYAVSAKGAVGLMQLMPETARDMNVNDRYDPRENIFGGSRYLKKLSRLFNGNLDLILASYNAGLHRVLSTRTIPDISETRRYIRMVRHYYLTYQRKR
ncbi:Soluble lytic murein transglycosylase precursor [hydrothermal vent metagenome]|uniref:Soluble lytic murein transglycosylase n=1 Tax=hydrothermal vent metagenome TaxID=652676 RepID=A0A3B0USE1_9ZZZZ